MFELIITVLSIIVVIAAAMNASYENSSALGYRPSTIFEDHYETTVMYDYCEWEK